jgi:hypothetical protein
VLSYTLAYVITFFFLTFSRSLSLFSAPMALPAAAAAAQDAHSGTSHPFMVAQPGMRFGRVATTSSAGVEEDVAASCSLEEISGASARNAAAFSSDEELCKRSASLVLGIACANKVLEDRPCVHLSLLLFDVCMMAQRVIVFGNHHVPHTINKIHEFCSLFEQWGTEEDPHFGDTFKFFAEAMIQLKNL